MKLLYRNEVVRAVREAERFMKGKVDLISVARYITSKGYITVFYNDKEPNPALELLKKTEFAKGVRGFTLLTKRVGGLGLVFINTDYGYAEQLKTLIHEAGHITLGHTENISYKGFIRNDLFEMQAETFAYLLINCPRKRFIRWICSVFSKVHSSIKDYYTEIKEVL